MPVTAASMAADTNGRLAAARRDVHLLDEVLVAATARGFRDLEIHRGDANRLREASGREHERVAESIPRLDPVLGKDLMRGVTVVAHGDGTMAGLHPARELLLHHVTVLARLRIVREIRSAARVEERVAADARGHTNRHGERERGDARQVQADNPSAGFVPTTTCAIRNVSERSTIVA